MKKKLPKKRFVIDAMTAEEIEALNTEIKRAQHRQRNHEKECRVESPERSKINSVFIF